MSTLLTARDLAKGFASGPLFSGVCLQIVEGDRLGLIGPNGAGKSTLMRLLAGLDTPDDGQVIARRGVTRAYVPQDDVFPDDATPLDAVVAALDPEATHSRLDGETRAAMVLSRLGFDAFDQPVRALSGGWRKRLSIACALVHEPDVLLLDEPTNHLDLAGIEWLERFVTNTKVAVVVVTHDRTFLERTMRRIIEISAAYPDGTFESTGDYSAFVRHQQAFLEAQRGQQSALANQVRRDTAWLRQGIQGRQTRNKTQVDAARERRHELAAIAERNLQPERTTTIDFNATQRRTKKLLWLDGVAKALGGRALFANVELLLTPGRRVGLLGPNGAGKTTLMRLVAGDLEPDAGTIGRAEGLRIVTFTQSRASLDPKQTLRQALCPVGEMVEYGGRSVHVSGWAQRFLFDSSQLSTTVGLLSGGEQARVLIANLMLEPADVLLLDEPTNDLDIPSLEVLESALLEFPGAMMLVTHDRFLMQRVATEVLALDGRGGAARHASYEQWESARAAAPEAAPAPAKPKRAKPASTSRKLSYVLQREADGMEEAILAAEAEVEALTAESSSPAVVADHVRHAEACRKLDEAQRRVAALYERWAELEAMQHPE